MSAPPDPFEFVKQLWGQMAVPGFGLTGNATPAAGGMQMPSFDPKELEKRLAELKQVKQWLEMNLNMMGLQINTLEMQLAGLNGLSAAATKAFGDHAANTVGAGGSQPGATAPWMDPQTWINFMQQQAAATQQAASQAMQDGAQAMQQATQSAAKAAATAAAKAAAKATTSATTPATANPATKSSAKRATKSATPKRAPRNKSA